MNNIENNLSEIIVILAEDGITVLNTVSKKTFRSYQLLGNNILEITEQSGMKTSCKINPHNIHAMQAVKKWLA